MEKQITTRVQFQILPYTKPERNNDQSLNKQFIKKQANKQDVLKGK